MGFTFTPSSKSADAPNVEGGLYDAKFDGITEKTIEGGQYGGGDRLAWGFTLLDDDGAVLYDEGDPVEVDGLTSTSMNLHSKTTPKAIKFLKALATPTEWAAFVLFDETGGEEGEALDGAALVGRVAQVDVAIRDSGWPTIVNVLPPRRRRSGAKAAAAQLDA